MSREATAAVAIRSGAQRFIRRANLENLRCEAQYLAE